MLLGEKEYKQALASLKKAYPDVRPALVYDTPFELLVSTMLAAQCTDKQVNKVTAVLYPLYSTPEQFARLTVEELEPYMDAEFQQVITKSVLTGKVMRLIRDAAIITE